MKGVPGAQRQICDFMSQLPDVQARPHRHGGFEFRIGRRELGHTHGDWLIDIPFPLKIRNEIVDAHEAEPHHVLPSSGWVSLFLRTEKDVVRGMRLLQRSFDLAVANRTQNNPK